MGIFETHNLPAKLEAIRKISDRYAALMKKLSGEERSFRVNLALTEALANAIRHGSQSERDSIVLRFRQTDSYVEFAITDAGEGPLTPLDFSAEGLQDPNEENHRGCTLIGWAADEIETEVTKEGFTLRMKFLLP